MRASAERLLYWAPRLLVFLFALFAGTFTIDSTGPHRGSWESLFAFGVHLIPSIVVLLVLAVAWQWELLGGALCVGMGVLYIVISNPDIPFGIYVLLSGAPIVVGALFWLHWWLAHRSPPSQQRPPLSPV
jgi:hypothetical protein